MGGNAKKAEADAVLVKVKKAEKLRKIARHHLKKEGKPIPAALKKGGMQKSEKIVDHAEEAVGTPVAKKGKKKAKKAKKAKKMKKMKKPIKKMKAKKAKKAIKGKKTAVKAAKTAVKADKKVMKKVKKAMKAK